MLLVINLYYKKDSVHAVLPIERPLLFLVKLLLGCDVARNDEDGETVVHVRDIDLVESVRYRVVIVKVLEGRLEDSIVL